MRVLYLNHTAEVSGGERSLLNLLGALPDTVEPLLATPPGRLGSEAHQLGLRTVPITGTAGSLRLHPLHTPLALGQLLAGAGSVRAVASRHHAEVIHANSIRAGIVLGLARPPRPTVVHVRDCLPVGPLTSATQRLIGATATVVVANSRYTAEAFRRGAPKARIQVVHNPVDLRRFDPERIDRMRARERLGEAGRSAFLMGVVAQLTPWKGQDTAIEALGILRREGIDAHLLLIGSAKFVARATRYDNQAFVEGLRRLVEREGLREHVSFMGERDDVPEIVRALDALLLPSWEEPFGRTLIEALALNVPVIATSVGGPAEIIEDGREGYLAPPRDPDAWAAAMRRLAESPQKAREMGRTGRRLVEARFTLDHHVKAMLEIYEQALQDRRR